MARKAAEIGDMPTTPRFKLTGLHSGNLTILGYRRNPKTGKNGWRCRCTCGKEVYHSATVLRREIVTSCGCLRKKSIGASLRVFWRQPGVKLAGAIRSKIGYAKKRAAIIAGNRASWSDPERRRLRVTAIKTAWLKPEVRTRHRLKMLTVWSRPDVRLKISNGLKQAYAQGRRVPSRARRLTPAEARESQEKRRLYNRAWLKKHPDAVKRYSVKRREWERKHPRTKRDPVIVKAEQRKRGKSLSRPEVRRKTALTKASPEWKDHFRSQMRRAAVVQSARAALRRLKGE